MSTVNRSLSDVAYSHLRERLAGGRFRAGTRLDYTVIGQQIGVSATPVREAMSRLASEGFVELVPRRGAVVRMPTRAELADAYDMRAILEPTATERATYRLSASDLRVMHEHVHVMKSLWIDEPVDGSTALDEKRLAVHTEHDRAFHQLIINSVESPLLKKFTDEGRVLTQLFALINEIAVRVERREVLTRTELETFRRMMFNAHSRAWHEHTEILEAIEEPNGPAAYSMMVAHIRASKKRFFAMYDFVDENGLLTADI